MTANHSTPPEHLRFVKPRHYNNQSLSPLFKVGTRGSLLAVTQCRYILQKISDRTGASFELIFIKTQGDQIVDRPLWQLEGKDFFTKELDEALAAQQVDLLVHSYKDLSSERPQQFCLAALTDRQFPHDLLLMSKQGLEKIQETQGLTHISLKIGTSSPRRQTNLAVVLKDLLPYGDKSQIEFSSLRGNVNTRLKKLQDGFYDGIILAWAGLERLLSEQTAAAEILALVSELHVMILPLNENPPAPGQGILAIECLKNEYRKDNQQLFSIIQHVHNSAVAQSAQIERQVFSSFGGGCHLAVGVFSDHRSLKDCKDEKDHQEDLKCSSNEQRFFARGTSDKFQGIPLAQSFYFRSLDEFTYWTKDLKGEKVQAQKSFTPIAMMISQKTFDNHIREKDKKYSYLLSPQIGQNLTINTSEVKRLINDWNSKTSLTNLHLHFASPYVIDAIDKEWLENLKKQQSDKSQKIFIWSPGGNTHRALAQRGLWAHGHGENLGEAEVEKYRHSHLIQQSSHSESQDNSRWWHLTGNESQSQFSLNSTTSTYHLYTFNAEQDSSLEVIWKDWDIKRQEQGITSFYWSSIRWVKLAEKYLPHLFQSPLKSSKDRSENPEQQFQHFSGHGKTLEYLRSSLQVDVTSVSLESLF